jgi:hypothetical protein
MVKRLLEQKSDMQTKRNLDPIYNDDDLPWNDVTDVPMGGGGVTSVTVVNVNHEEFESKRQWLDASSEYGHTVSSARSRIVILSVYIKGLSKLGHELNRKDQLELQEKFNIEFQSIVQNQSGSVELFINDNIDIIFGAPWHSKNSLGKALKASKAMMHLVRSWNEKLSGKQKLSIRICADSVSAIFSCNGDEQLKFRLPEGSFSMSRQSLGQVPENGLLMTWRVANDCHLELFKYTEILHAERDRPVELFAVK